MSSSSEPSYVEACRRAGQWRSPRFVDALAVLCDVDPVRLRHDIELCEKLEVDWRETKALKRGVRQGGYGLLLRHPKRNIFHPFAIEHGLARRHGRERAILSAMWERYVSRGLVPEWLAESPARCFANYFDVGGREPLPTMLDSMAAFVAMDPADVLRAEQLAGELLARLTNLGHGVKGGPVKWVPWWSAYVGYKLGGQDGVGTRAYEATRRASQLRGSAWDPKAAAVPYLEAAAGAKAITPWCGEHVSRILQSLVTTERLWRAHDLGPGSPAEAALALYAVGVYIHSLGPNGVTLVTQGESEFRGRALDIPPHTRR